MRSVLLKFSLSLFLLICLLFTSAHSLFSQKREDKELIQPWTFGPTFGLHSGNGIGIEGGIGTLVYVVEHDDEYTLGSLSATMEVILGNDGGGPIIAPRLSAWYTAVFFTAGLGAGYYSRDGDGVLMLQPEIGIGAWTNRITLRVNIPITEDKLNRFSNSNFNVVAFFPL